MRTLLTLVPEREYPRERELLGQPPPLVDELGEAVGAACHPPKNVHRRLTVVDLEDALCPRAFVQYPVEVGLPAGGLLLRGVERLQRVLRPLLHRELALRPAWRPRPARCGTGG